MDIRSTLFLCCLFFLNISLSQDLIIIESSEYAIVLKKDSLKRLQHVYFGSKASNLNEYRSIDKQLRYEVKDAADLPNHVYTPSGTWNTSEPALQILHSDGNPSTELEYKQHIKKNLGDGVSLLTVTLVDPIYKTEVLLFYKVYHEENVFEQWSTIKNNEVQAIELKKYASANLYFRNNDFFLTQYHGAWGSEMQPETHLLTSGIKVLDSKLGTRSNLYAPPNFILSLDGIAKEDTGKVLLASLAWSGNYRFDFEKDRFNNLRLIAGANNFASEYKLEANQVFETPHFIYTYSEKGKNQASINMQRWSRKYRIHEGEGDRLTLLNNWEATHFNFNEKKIVALIDQAKEIGIDVFLLDDGWFGNKYPRNNDRAGLGDWEVNQNKLPNGLSNLTKKANKRGVKFGIWIEPEMVNPKSELYENHLDWVIRQPNRKEYYYRNQLVLDLSNPEVQNHVFGVFDNLFIENSNISFVKWDANSIIYNAYSEYLARNKLPQSHLYYEYVKGLYKVLERVREKYPKVPIMLCSGGGGRVDYGALQYFTEFWPSDNTNALDRIFMHWEYSHFYPAIAMSSHVTNWNKESSIKFRVDVASIGKLGFDIEIDKLSEEEKEFCKQALLNYKSLQKSIWHGDMYRLQDPYENPIASIQYVNQEKTSSVVFSFLISQRFQTFYSNEPILFKGLDPKKIYEIEEINLFHREITEINQEATYSGEYLMKFGFNPIVTDKRKSVVLKINEITL